MAYPQLYVIFYQPRYGNYQHWALYLQGPKHLIFEVIGSHPNLHTNEVEADPQKSGSYLGKLYFGAISDKDITTVSECVTAVYASFSCAMRSE